MSEERRKGGQFKSTEERKRHNLTFRCDDALRAALGAAADDNLRSISEEITYRLRQSFSTFRIDEQLRTTLAVVAAENRRTLSQEITHRLQESLVVASAGKAVVTSSAAAVSEVAVVIQTAVEAALSPAALELAFRRVLADVLKQQQSNPPAA
jgi:hypothetical protein